MRILKIIFICLFISSLSHCGKSKKRKPSSKINSSLQVIIANGTSVNLQDAGKKKEEQKIKIQNDPLSSEQENENESKKSTKNTIQLKIFRYFIKNRGNEGIYENFHRTDLHENLNTQNGNESKLVHTQSDRFTSNGNNTIDLIYNSNDKESNSKKLKTVGILGLGNIGKTSFMKDLIEQFNGTAAFPPDQTKGIIFYKQVPESENDLLFIDTQGLSKPSNINWDEIKNYTNNTYFQLNRKQAEKYMRSQLNDQFLDREMIDMLQIQILFEMSQHLILMTNYLEKRDQILIESIIFKLFQSENHENKNIFIVHQINKETNLDYYCEYIQKVFPIKKVNEKELIFNDSRSNKITHFIVQKDEGNVNSVKYLKKIVDKVNLQNGLHLNIREDVKVLLEKEIERLILFKPEDIMNNNTKTLYSPQFECLEYFKCEHQILEGQYCEQLILKPKCFLSKAHNPSFDFKTNSIFELYQISTNQLELFVDLPAKQKVSLVRIVYQYGVNFIIILSENEFSMQNKVLIQYIQLPNLKGNKKYLLIGNLNTQNLQLLVKLLIEDYYN